MTHRPCGITTRGLGRLARDLGCSPSAALEALRDAGVSIGPSGLGGAYQVDCAGRALAETAGTDPAAGGGDAGFTDADLDMVRRAVYRGHSEGLRQALRRLCATDRTAPAHPGPHGGSCAP